jgi:hypothetical protein
MEDETPKNLPTLMEKIGAWGQEDVVRFIDLIDCDFDGLVDDTDQHMLFRPEHHSVLRSAVATTANRHSHVEPRPLYLIEGQYYDARRIAIILFDQYEPLDLGVIESQCGQMFCVNPRHLGVSSSRDSNKRHRSFYSPSNPPTSPC